MSRASRHARPRRRRSYVGILREAPVSVRLRASERLALERAARRRGVGPSALAATLVRDGVCAILAN